METKINKILQTMQGALNAEQMQLLDNTLTLVLLEKEAEKNELACIDDNSRLLNMFFANLKIAGRSDKTIAKYALDLKNLLEFLENKDIKDIKSDELKYYLAWYQQQRKVSNTTLENMRLTFSSFFGWLENEDYILKSPVRKIPTIKKDTQPERELYGDEIERLKNATKNLRDKTIIEFLYSTGCRISEMCSAKRSDIDWQNKQLIVNGKGNKERPAFLTDVALYYLKEYLQTRTDSCDALFVTLKGDPVPVKRNSIERMFKRLCEVSGVEGVHPHRFRVTRITNLANRGVQLQSVQSIVGHTNINTTQRYFRGNNEFIKAEFFRVS